MYHATTSWQKRLGETPLNQRKVTINDVAREAGVSIATVSRVVQGKTTVSEELAARVRAAAEALGYRPSPVARGLATGESGLVGVLVPQLANPYFYEVIKAIGSGAGQDGYRMLLLESDDRPADEFELADTLYRHADGVILCSPRMPDEQLSALAADRPHLLCVSRLPPDGKPPSLTHDPYTPMVEICRLLAGLGHRRVVYVSGVSHSWVNAERRRAVEQSVSLGLEPYCVPAGPSIDDGYAATDAALEYRPTALLGATDLCAIGILARLRDLHLRVPEDISVTGFDDIPYSRHLRPSLTTARTARQELGERVWSVMRSILANEPVPPRQVLTTTELLVRESTGPAPR